MNAPNREKIMKALECHADTTRACAEECPYAHGSTDDILCSEALARDALKLIETLLKENAEMRNEASWADEHAREDGGRALARKEGWVG